MTTPRKVYEALASVPGYNGKDQSAEKSRSGYVGLDDLLAVVGHHTLRTVTISAGPWGVTDIPKKQVTEAYKRPGFQERLRIVLEKARLEKPGCLLEASITLRLSDYVKHEAYTIIIHSVLIRMDNDQAYYID